MQPTLATLVQHTTLKLGVLAGEDRLDAEVRWAHASELADPVPWLDGGELLLVTGLQLPVHDEAEMRAYVARLAAAGVVGLGFGVGVNHPEVPPALLTAVREAGLPLLEVPRRTPFMAISKAVSAAIAAEQYRAVTAGFAAQRELTSAALSAGGHDALLERLAVQVGGWAALYDLSGSVTAAAPCWAGRRAAKLAAEVRRLADRPAPSSAVCATAPEDDRVELQSVGTGTLPRAVLAIGTDAALGTAERYAVQSAVAVLTLLTERSGAYRAAEARLGGAVLRMLVSGEPDHARAVAGQLYGGLLDAPLRVLVAAPGGDAKAMETLSTTVEAAAARAGESVLTAVDGDGLVLVAADGGAAVAACLAYAREEPRSRTEGGLALGMSATTGLSSADRAYQRARRPRWWRAGAGGRWWRATTWEPGRWSRCWRTTRCGPSRTACCARCASTTNTAGATWSRPCAPGSPATASGTRRRPTSESTATRCATGCGGWRRSWTAHWTTRTSGWSCGCP